MGRRRRWALRLGGLRRDLGAAVRDGRDQEPAAVPLAGGRSHRLRGDGRGSAAVAGWRTHVLADVPRPGRPSTASSGPARRSSWPVTAGSLITTDEGGPLRRTGRRAAGGRRSSRWPCPPTSLRIRCCSPRPPRAVSSARATAGRPTARPVSKGSGCSTWSGSAPSSTPRAKPASTARTGWTQPWTRLAASPGRPHRLMFPLAPAAGLEAFLATDRGIFRTADAGEHWQPSGLPGQDVFEIATFPAPEPVRTRSAGEVHESTRPRATISSSSPSALLPRIRPPGRAGSVIAIAGSGVTASCCTRPSRTVCSFVC